MVERVGVGGVTERHRQMTWWGGEDSQKDTETDRQSHQTISISNTRLMRTNFHVTMCFQISSLLLLVVQLSLIHISEPTRRS